MTKLSDTQAILLSAAAQRADGNLLPLPGSLRGGAAIKVVTALLARGFAREVATDLQTRADAALNTVWRNEPDGRAVLLRIAPAGLEAIGIEPVGEPAAAPTGDPVEYRFNAGINSAGEPAASPAEAAVPIEAPKKGRPKKVAAATDPTATPAPGKTRDGTKQAQLIAMLQRKDGATIAQIVAANGWQPHTVRGAFAGALKKKLGLIVTSEKAESGERVYRLPKA